MVKHVLINEPDILTLVSIERSHRQPSDDVTKKTPCFGRSVHQAPRAYSLPWVSPIAMSVVLEEQACVERRDQRQEREDRVLIGAVNI